MSEEAAGGISLGKVGGVPVRIGYSWIVLAGFIVAIYGPHLAANVPGLGAKGYLVAAVLALSLLVAVLAHEAAHAVVARSCGLKVHRVVADLWGGHTAFEAGAAGPGKSALVAVAGPATNVVLGLAYPLTSAESYTVSTYLISQFGYINLILAAFNLLPGLPLDGGQLVQAAVWGATGSRTKGYVVAGWAGRVVTVAVIAAYLLVPLLDGRRPSLVTAVWLLFVGSFLWRGASQAVAVGTTRARVERVALRPLLRPVTFLSEQTPVAQAAGSPGIPVVLADDGEPLGWLDGSALARVPDDERGRATAGSVMVGAQGDWTVEADPGGDALPVVMLISAHRAPVVLVSWQGQWVGAVIAAEAFAAIEAH